MTDEERAAAPEPDVEPEVEVEPEVVTVAPDDVDLDAAGDIVEADLAALESVAAERDEYLAQLQRVAADFDNYRKRVMRDKADEVARAAESLVGKLLDVLDTFDLAAAHGEGFEQGHAQLLEVLAKEGLERIDPSGKPFDPAEHDAVAHEPADDAADPTVADVLRAGWRWKGRVLRPAMVKVRG
jgi:molecular chaperone GrpE